VRKLNFKKKRQQQSGGLRGKKSLLLVCLFVARRNHLTGVERNGNLLDFIPGQITTVAQISPPSTLEKMKNIFCLGVLKGKKLIKTSSFSRFCLFQRHPNYFPPALPMFGKTHSCV
jgi:hypothetical protein